ncbi:MAG: beta-lactamase family protein, partial [Candidatus Eremiobacteraeota bacterium]|nr:beta-lactamase family protein [Candidatus Eremiobacteraeota bacterium]
TKWAYSNTNYILLGKVIEAASHESYTAYLFEHVVKPAGMSHTVTMDEERSLPDVATGYRPKIKGTLSPAPPFGGGWAWSAGYLVSNIDDMVKWDGAFFGGKIISPGDVNLATTSFQLRDGKSTGYGMGWIDDTQDGHRRIWHNGGTFGFTSANVTYPNEHLAIIVLTNALAPTQAIASRIFEVLYPPTIKAAAGEDPKVTARAKEWIRRFQTGNMDRSQLDKKMADALTPTVVESVKAQLSALGDPTRVTFSSKTPLGTSTVYVYRVDFASASLNMQMSIDAAGKINGVFFKPA